MSQNKVIENIEQLKVHHFCYGCYEVSTSDKDTTFTNTTIPFNNVVGDCWDSSKNYYVCPESGIYRVEFNCFSNNRDAIDQTSFRLNLIKNGNREFTINNGYGGINMAITLPCNKGDTLAIGTDFQLNFYAGRSHNYFSIYLIT